MTWLADILGSLRWQVQLPKSTMRWLLALVVGVTLSQAMQNHPATPTVMPEILSVLPQNPNVLSDSDALLYKMILTAQSRSEFESADAMLAQLSNRYLVGYVLAERYLNTGYHASAAELRNWLVRYNDHPQTRKIVALALQRGFALASAYKSEEPLRGDGYADHLGRSSMPAAWYSGLRLWRERHYSEAAPLFKQVADDTSLSDWQRSAGHYWAYRADFRAGERSSARDHLEQAANYKTTFYGLIASRQMGRVDFAISAPDVSSSLRRNPSSIRAGLLASLGRTEAAEEELRHLYSAADASERSGIITMASELGLPNLQLRLARVSGLSADEALFANYPTPHFMVDAQHQVDPALLLAIARNESSFRVDAKSSGGAVGMMQMLPSTARAVERKFSNTSLNLASANDSSAMAERLADPKQSVRLGAQYVKLLLNEPVINGNLVRLLAGYNAGPGTVAGWEKTAKHIDDPLLYVESIPYPETHNYVMQVLAQYWVYQHLLGEESSTLTAMARGQWPQIRG